MNVARPLALLALAGCSGDDAPLMTTADGAIQLVFSADAQWQQDLGRQEMESALARFPEIDVVYAHNDPMARGAQLAAQQAGRDGISFVGIDALAQEGLVYVRQGMLAATFEYPTGGAEAVDLAVLLLNDIEVEKEIILGTRVYTRTNIGDGGEAISAPGDDVIAELRERYRNVIETPSTDHVFKLGLSQCNIAEPWRAQMNEDIRKRVAELSFQLELIEKNAQNDSATQRGQIEELIAEGVHAILVSPKESVSLKPAIDQAMDAGIEVIVLDRRVGGDNYSCFIGGDNTAIGRAAGEFVKQRLGGNGTIVEIKGLWTSSPAQERHRGFVEALGLK